MQTGGLKQWGFFSQIWRPEVLDAGLVSPEASPWPFLWCPNFFLQGHQSDQIRTHPKELI